MKMKKLLSIGAIGLALACSTSIGASAGTTSSLMSAKTKALIEIVAKDQYQNGTNQTDLFAGVNKDSKLSSISNDDVITAINSKYTTTGSAVRIAEAKFDNNKDITFAAALDKVTKDEATFDRFKNDFTTVADKIAAMDSQIGDTRGNSEKQFIALAHLYNSNLNVKFGKDAEGRTSSTLKEGDKLLVQLNYDEVKTALNEVDNLTLDKANAAKNYLNSIN
jgi:lipopolysaccharide export LptBFGC system permease protein LptF